MPSPTVVSGEPRVPPFVVGTAGDVVVVGTVGVVVGGAGLVGPTGLADDTPAHKNVNRVMIKMARIIFSLIIRYCLI